MTILSKSAEGPSARSLSVSFTLDALEKAMAMKTAEVKEMVGIVVVLEPAVKLPTAVLLTFPTLK